MLLEYLILLNNNMSLNQDELPPNPPVLARSNAIGSDIKQDVTEILEQVKANRLFEKVGPRTREEIKRIESGEIGYNETVVDWVSKLLRIMNGQTFSQGQNTEFEVYPICRVCQSQ